MVAVAAVSNLAISASGAYQKCFVDPPVRRLCHILDPRTGWPVQNHVGGVTIIAGDSMTAHALATVLFVMGEEKGLRFVDAWADAAALFVVSRADGSFTNVLSARFASASGYQP